MITTSLVVKCVALVLGEMDVVSTLGRKQPPLGNYYSLSLVSYGGPKLYDNMFVNVVWQIGCFIWGIPFP
jgi:hypothetical protein